MPAHISEISKASGLIHNVLVAKGSDQQIGLERRDGLVLGRIMATQRAGSSGSIVECTSDQVRKVINAVHSDCLYASVLMRHVQLFLLWVDQESVNAQIGATISRTQEPPPSIVEV